MATHRDQPCQVKKQQFNKRMDDAMEASMASKSENADIAVLQTQMDSALQGIASINRKLDNQANLFVPRTEFDEFKKRWALSHFVVSIGTAAVTALIVYFINSKG